MQINELPEPPAPIEAMAIAFYAGINPGMPWTLLDDAHKCRIRNGAYLAFTKQSNKETE